MFDDDCLYGDASFSVFPFGGPPAQNEMTDNLQPLMQTVAWSKKRQQTINKINNIITPVHWGHRGTEVAWGCGTVIAGTATVSVCAYCLIITLHSLHILFRTVTPFPESHNLKSIAKIQVDLYSSLLFKTLFTGSWSLFCDMSVEVNVEYCGAWGYEPRYRDLAQRIAADVPGAKVSGFVGRRSSFEVKVNDKVCRGRLLLFEYLFDWAEVHLMRTKCTGDPLEAEDHGLPRFWGGSQDRSGDV